VWDFRSLNADVYFGATDKPLPNWRAGLNVRADEDAEDGPLSKEDRRALVAMLGFDPAELDDAKDLSLSEEVDALTDGEGKYEGYTIRLIDATRFRGTSRKHQEYGLWATHADFEEIPEREIWLDDQSDPKDRPYFLKNAAAYLEKLREGESQGDAYDYGKTVEEAEREKSKDGSRPFHDEVPDGVYLKHRQMLDLDGEQVQVWIVNGFIVRNIYKTDFVSGGNAYVYPFMPEDEIWLANHMSDEEMDFTLLHETTERSLMKSEQLDYDDAHQYASKVEFQARQEAKRIS
jgi:hypothetical protein